MIAGGRREADGLRRLWRAIPLAFLAGGALTAACTDIPTGPDEPFSIEFSALPFPAVVLGDTLRAADGTPAALRATVYNVNGTPIIDPPLEFLVPGRGATLLGGVYIRGDSIVQRGVPIYARVNGLQSLPLTLYVVPAAPDTLIQVADATLELIHDVLPQPDTSGALKVRVARADVGSAGDLAGVEHWPVYFTLVAHGDTIARQDTSLVWLVQASSLTPATADTTDATGTAAVRVRANGFSRDIDGLDSVVVYVSTPRLNAAPLTTHFTIRLRARP